MERFSSRAVVGVVALVAASLGTSAMAGAQQAPATCGGLDATIVVDGNPPTAVGTEDDDVVLIDTLNGITFRALGGNDTVCMTDAFAHHTIIGGAGDDTIYASDEDGVFYGDDDEDPTQTGDDIIYGGPGDDIIYGGPGDDIIYGRDGFDGILAGPGNDLVYAGLFSDVVWGGPGDDILHGGPGPDIMYGQQGRDELYGGADNDWLFSDVEIDGEIDPDFRYDVTGINSRSVSIDTAGARLQGGPGDDRLFGSNRWDRMLGGDGDDVLLGFEGRDWMRGGNGNDLLLGGPGIDNVNGNMGNDELVISGPDTGKGGHGRDACFTGRLSDANTVTCETAEIAGPEWEDLEERIRGGFAVD